MPEELIRRAYEGFISLTNYEGMSRRQYIKYFQLFLSHNLLQPFIYITEVKLRSCTVLFVLIFKSHAQCQFMLNYDSIMIH